MNIAIKTDVHFNTTSLTSNGDSISPIMDLLKIREVIR